MPADMCGNPSFLAYFTLFENIRRRKKLPTNSENVQRRIDQAF
jgi:hypothetical protein